MFLTDAQLIKLTGYKQKSRQIAQLRAEGIPFWINAAGEPCVTVAAVEGRESKPQQQGWQPAWGGFPT